MERTAERQGHPEDERHGDHHGRERHDEHQQERRGSDATDQRQLCRGAWSEPSGEGAQEVGNEGHGRQRGQAQRFETASPGDRRQQGGHERHRDADARRGDEVEREIAPERAPAR